MTSPPTPPHAPRLHSLLFQVTRRPNLKELSQEHGRCQRWLNKKRIKAFYTHVFSDNLRHGAQFLMQVRAARTSRRLLHPLHPLSPSIRLYIFTYYICWCPGGGFGPSEAQHLGHGLQEQLE